MKKEIYPECTDDGCEGFCNDTKKCTFYSNGNLKKCKQYKPFKFESGGAMKICGILITKEKSIRFPGKNRLLWEDNANILIDCVGLKNVFMFTDDDKIQADCIQKGIGYIEKNINFTDEMTYLDALRFAYHSLYEKYDIIVTIQCNTVGHDKSAIIDGIDMLSEDPHADEIRSFDAEGFQSGIFIFRADRLPEKWHHMASIVSNGKEIHYKEELE